MGLQAHFHELLLQGKPAVAASDQIESRFERRQCPPLFETVSLRDYALHAPALHVENVYRYRSGAETGR